MRQISVVLKRKEKKKEGNEREQKDRYCHAPSAPNTVSDDSDITVTSYAGPVYWVSRIVCAAKRFAWFIAMAPRNDRGMSANMHLGSFFLKVRFNKTTLYPLV